MSTNIYAVGDKVEYVCHGAPYNGTTGMVVEVDEKRKSVAICWEDHKVNTYRIGNWTKEVIIVTLPAPATPAIVRNSADIKVYKKLPARAQYIVWSPDGDCNPSVVHDTCPQARAEAERLTKATGKPFYWMHISGGFQAKHVNEVQITAI